MYDFWGCVTADATATRARSGRILSFIFLKLVLCRCCSQDGMLEMNPWWGERLYDINSSRSALLAPTQIVVALAA
jgi:hypothetical protein